MNKYKCEACGREERSTVYPAKCGMRDDCLWHYMETERPPEPASTSAPTPQGPRVKPKKDSCLVVLIVGLIGIGFLLSVAFADDEKTPSTSPTSEAKTDSASLMAQRLLAKRMAERSEEGTPTNAAMEARAWLLENGGIAIIVGDGTEDTATPDQLGKAIVKNFRERYNIKAAYFVRPSTARVNTLTFENRYHPLGIGLIDKNGQKTGIYTPSMWAEEAKADALFEEVYTFHIASLERQVAKEKRK